ncbi:thermostable hemolysin [Marinimicrobium koreense]|uniref:Thermostable hemolysin n=1 Tax=Marinimicrobium koreense TaxID=306545 RepID=A0A3N1NP69_9GAMM|nr:thermostable hemolysin [Marinimicrobium koreense]ROQ21534.1 thermostable hemolysin [Marinimicrobium koreense]
MSSSCLLPLKVDLFDPSVTELMPVGDWKLCSVNPESRATDAIAFFIEQRFRAAYGRCPSLVVPSPLILVARSGLVMAAVGTRHAADQPLFLEDYLDHPIEQYLPPGALGHREGVVEIAHLAGAVEGVSRLFFPAIARWLVTQGVEWICFTGTQSIRLSFAKMGVKPRVLGPALPERLQGAAQDWGAYYQNRPEVVLAHVPSGVEAMRHTGWLGKTTV